MKNIIAKGFESLLLLQISLNVSAQTSVSGVIKSKNGEVLSGVIVKIKGTDLGTFTDAKGAYDLEVPENGTLLFSFIGFETIEKQVYGMSKVDIDMVETSQQFSELVIVAYRSTNWSPDN